MRRSRRRASYSEIDSIVVMMLVPMHRSPHRDGGEREAGEEQSAETSGGEAYSAAIHRPALEGVSAFGRNAPPNSSVPKNEKVSTSSSSCRK
jgi:hypothetical protein